VRSDTVFFAILLTGMIACHRDNPSPMSPTATGDAPALTVTIRSARPPHQVIPQARLSIEGLGVYDANASGVITLPEMDSKQVIQVVAEGYVSPFTIMLWQTIEGTLYLLPDDGDMSWSWLYEAYYKSKEDGSLWRPEPGVVDIEAAAEIYEDTRVLRALEWGIGTVNQAQPNISYVLSGAGSTVRLYRDPDDPIFDEPGYEHAWAVAFVHLDAGVVVGGRIVFRFLIQSELTERHIPRAMAHELAHLTALNGHPPGGIMAHWDIVDDFSPLEKLAMYMAFLRPPGTRPPDNAAGALTHSSGPSGPGFLTAAPSGELAVCVLDF